MVGPKGATAHALRRLAYLRSFLGVTRKESESGLREAQPAASSRSLAFFAVALAVLFIGGFLALVSFGRPDRAPSPGFSPEAFLPTIDRGQSLCDPQETVPAGATGVELTLGAFGRKTGTAVDVVGVEGKRVVLRGGRRFEEGQNVFVPFASRVRRAQEADLCIKNVGRFPIQVGGKPGFGPSFRYPGADRESWLRSAPEVASRFQRVRFAPFGEASLWLFLAVALGSVVVGVSTILLVARR